VIIILSENDMATNHYYGETKRTTPQTASSAIPAAGTSASAPSIMAAPSSSPLTSAMAATASSSPSSLAIAAERKPTILGKDLFAQTTKGAGDCPFHSLLGEWDGKQFICKEVEKKREEVGEAIKAQQHNLVLRPLIMEGIKELMRINRPISRHAGAASNILLRKFQRFQADQNGIELALWSQFEQELQKHSVITGYIEQHHTPAAATTLRQKFYSALNQNEGELRARILSINALETALKTFNELFDAKFDWDTNITASIIAEYADFIAKPTQWLLASELAIVAHTLQRTVIYYPHENAQSMLLNPGARETVRVLFVGNNHFERVVEKNHLVSGMKGFPQLTVAQKKAGENPPRFNQSAGDAVIAEDKEEEKNPVASGAGLPNTKPVKRKLLAYNKRRTLTDTEPGIEFQVLNAMCWAFSYTYEVPTDFELRCEDIEYGIFDDLVIITNKHTHANQYKLRVNEGEEAKLSCFVSEGGSGSQLMLYKYFDSVCNRLDNEKDEAFSLISNQPLTPELSKYLDGNGGFFPEFFARGGDAEIEYLYGLLVASINKFAKKRAKEIPIPSVAKLASFLLNYLNLNEERLGEKQYTSGVGKKIFDFIRPFEGEKKSFKKEEKKALVIEFLQGLQEASPALGKDVVAGFVEILTATIPLPKVNVNLYDIACAAAAPNIKEIENFLKKLRLKFSSPNSMRLKEALQKKIKDKFNITSSAIFHAFYNKFYAWLISKTAEALDRTEIEDLFKGWKNNYIYLERLYGLTDINLKNIAAKLENRHYFDRPRELEQLEKFVANESHGKNIVFLLGEAGIGKSCLVEKYFQKQALAQGQALFIDIRDFSHLAHDFSQQTRGDLVLSCFEGVRVIFIDNVELATYDKKLKDFLMTLTEQVKHADLKLVFLSRHKEIDVELNNILRNKAHDLTLPPLPLQLVLQHYPTLKSIIDRNELEAISADEKNSDLTPLSEDQQEFKRDEKNPAGDVADSIGYKGILHLLTIPFYLDLILRHQAQLSAEIRNFHSGQMQLTHFIITLVIEQRGKPKSGIVAQDLSKLRTSLLRKLLYAKNNAEIANFMRNLTKPEQAVLSDLVNEGVLIKGGGPNKESFYFGHLLYEEWVANDILTSRLGATLEAEDSIENLITDLNRLLPKMKYFWARELETTPLLDEYLAHRFPEQYLPEADNFSVLLRVAIFARNQKMFDCVRPYVSSLTSPLLQRLRLLLLSKKYATDLSQFRGVGIFIVDTDHESYASFSITIVEDNGKVKLLEIPKEEKEGWLADKLASMLRGADPQPLKMIANFNLIKQLRGLLIHYGAGTISKMPITFLGDAIDAQNIVVARSLLEYKDGSTPGYSASDLDFPYEGTATAYKRKLRDADNILRQDRADGARESNWRVYIGQGRSEDEYASVVPYKYIFREGREDTRANSLSERFDDPRRGMHSSPIFLDNCFDAGKIKDKNAAFLKDKFFYFNKARKIPDPVMMKLLMDHSDKAMRNQYLESALHLAVLAQDVSLVENLLISGFPIDEVDYDNETALHNAIYCSKFFKKYAQHKVWANDEEDRVCYKIFHLLLQAYAKKELSLHKKNLMGWSPLHLAILMRDPVMISALVKSGALNSMQACKVYLLQYDPTWQPTPSFLENAWCFFKTSLNLYYYYNEKFEISPPIPQEWFVEQGIFDKFQGVERNIIALDEILTTEQLAEIKKKVHSIRGDLPSKNRHGHTPQDLLELVNEYCADEQSSVHVLSLQSDPVDHTRQPFIVKPATAANPSDRAPSISSSSISDAARQLPTAGLFAPTAEETKNRKRKTPPDQKEKGSEPIDKKDKKDKENNGGHRTPDLG
jgi:ankyrin repeat protein/DNA replication protein DnaC